MAFSLNVLWEASGKTGYANKIYINRKTGDLYIVDKVYVAKIENSNDAIIWHSCKLFTKT